MDSENWKPFLTYCKANKAIVGDGWQPENADDESSDASLKTETNDDAGDSCGWNDADYDEIDAGDREFYFVRPEE
jgi:hypothetical protein